MKKLLKTLNAVCVFALVVSTLMLFSTSAFAYSGTGDYDDPVQISTFVDGDPLPVSPTDDSICYVNDLSCTLYLYTDAEWADLYFCIEDVPPFAYAERQGEYEPGDLHSWFTYENQFGEPAIMRIFLCEHNVLSPVERKAPTCTEDGVEEHYQCNDCGWLYEDEDHAVRIYDEDELTIPALAHASIESVAAKAPTCTKDGMKAHYRCADCGKLFSDEAGTTEVIEDKLIVPATGHTSKVLPGKAATYDATGLTDGEICEVCGTILVEQKIIPKLEKDKEPEKESPDTSDAYALYICLAFALVSLTSISIVLKKQHNM